MLLDLSPPSPSFFLCVCKCAHVDQPRSGQANLFFFETRSLFGLELTDLGGQQALQVLLAQYPPGLQSLTYYVGTGAQTQVLVATQQVLSQLSYLSNLFIGFL